MFRLLSLSLCLLFLSSCAATVKGEGYKRPTISPSQSMEMNKTILRGSRSIANVMKMGHAFNVEQLKDFIELLESRGNMQNMFYIFVFDDRRVETNVPTQSGDFDLRRN